MEVAAELPTVNDGSTQRTLGRKLVIGGIYLVVGLWITNATLWAADPVIGTWKLNLAKSTFSPGPPPKSGTRTYEANGDGIKATFEGVNSEGKSTSSHYTASYDGKDNSVTGEGVTIDTVALKRINVNTVESTTKKDGKVVGTGKRVVSKDGKVMTINATGVNEKGEKFHNVIVYDKQ